MKRRLLIIFSFLLLSLLAHGQTKSPQVFLGYPLGERFTPHHRIVDYFEHVAAHNENVILKYYGETFEHRPLLVVWVSAQSSSEATSASLVPSKDSRIPLIFSSSILTFKDSRYSRESSNSLIFSKTIPVYWLAI